MAIKEMIVKVVEGRSLRETEAAAAMLDIVEGLATPSQIAAFVIGLRMKGETAEEIAGLARIMRRYATRVEAGSDAVDIVGTGGDGGMTFNISTVSALVTAAAGGKVAKHGNRGVTSKCGAADILEAFGVAFDLPPAAVAECIRETGFGFMFAPIYHPAMRHAVVPRREIGVRTVFNLLGPITNPAGVTSQVTGVGVALGHAGRSPRCSACSARGGRWSSTARTAWTRSRSRPRPRSTTSPTARSASRGHAGVGRA